MSLPQFLAILLLLMSGLSSVLTWLQNKKAPLTPRFHAACNFISVVIFTIILHWGGFWNV
jgi:hypothetical protein